MLLFSLKSSILKGWPWFLVEMLLVKEIWLNGGNHDAAACFDLTKTIISAFVPKALKRPSISLC
jgi:hypothetical protein